MLRTEIDGRLALRIREIAETQTDTGALSAEEKARILNVAADRFEEYILAVLTAAPTAPVDRELSERLGRLAGRLIANDDCRISRIGACRELDAIASLLPVDEGWGPIEEAKTRTRYMGAFMAPHGCWEIVGPGSVREGVFRDYLGEHPTVSMVFHLPPLPDSPSVGEGGGE